ncbi:MAG: hypothetical protein ACI9K2_006546 [Myxococcota bacterium]
MTLDAFTPGAPVMVLVGDSRGSASLPDGLCGGMPTGLSSGRRPAPLYRADPSGALEIRVPVSSRSCDASIQVVDAASCTPTPVVEPAGGPMFVAVGGVSDDTRQLWAFDTASGAASQLGELDYAVTGLAYDHRTGRLYGVTGRDGLAVDLDPGSGAVLDTFPVYGGYATGVGMGWTADGLVATERGASHWLDGGELGPAELSWGFDTQPMDPAGARDGRMVVLAEGDLVADLTRDPGCVSDCAGAVHPLSGLEATLLGGGGRDAAITFHAGALWMASNDPHADADATELVQVDPDTGAVIATGLLFPSGQVRAIAGNNIGE